MATSSKVIGTVVAVEGEAFIRTPDGSKIAIRVGQTLHEGDVVVTGENGKVQLDFNDGGDFLLAQNETVTLDSSVFSTDLPATKDVALLPQDLNSENVAKNLALGNSLDELLEETAAGLSGDGGSSGSHEAMWLSRISEAMSPLAFEFGSTERPRIPELPEVRGMVSNSEPDPEPDAGRVIAPRILSIDGDSRAEGAALIHLVTLTNSSAEPITFSFELNGISASANDFGTPIFSDGVTWNGSTITVPAGIINFTVTIPTSNDVYLEGREGLNLVIDGFSAIGEISDSIDAVTVDLSAGDIDEDAGSVTFTATLSHASQGTTTIETDRGTITIADGATTGTLVVDVTADPDVYAEDDEELTVEITSASGGGFENLEVGVGSATATISDSIDAVTVILSGVATVNEGATASYTVSLTNAADTDVTVNLTYSGTAEDGSDFTGVASVVIAAGSDSVTFDIGTLDDILAEGAESFTVTIASASGGNFENLVVSSTEKSVTTEIADNDISTVSLSATPSISEAGGSILYTATVTQAPLSDLTVNLSNGSSITILAGQLSGTRSLAVGSQEDVYAEMDSISATITGTAGGDIDVAINPAAAVTSIVDTIDTTTVTLTADSTVAEGGQITYTASLNNAAQTPVTVVLSNGAEITIAANTLSGSVTVDAPTEDVYVDAGTINVTIADATGGNFENLEIEPTAAVTAVSDTTNTTTVTLSSATNGSEITEGGSIVYTATVGNAVTGSALVVTLSNNQTITIPVGATSASSASYLVRPDNPYINADDSLSVSITDTEGGNFEAIATSGTVANTVVDDADLTTVSITGNAAVMEGGTATYTVSLTSAGTTDVTVSLTYSGTAEDGSDFTGVATVMIPAGSSAVDFDVLTFMDSLAEGAEGMTVAIDTVTGGGFESLTVSGTAGSVTTVIASNDEDVTQIFSTATGNSIAVAEMGAADTVLTTTVNANHGSLTMVTIGLAAEAAFTGNGTESVTITGTAGQINAALNGMSYAPTPDYNGLATLAVSTTDGITTNTGTINVTIAAVGDIAGNNVTTNEDTAVSIAVLGNDSFENADRAVTSVTHGAHGTVTFTASGVVYTPDADYHGSDSFTYTATSGGVTETATVNVIVEPVNDGPVAVADVATVGEDTASVAGDVTPVAGAGRDTDADVDDVLTVTGVAAGTVGSAVGNVGGTVSGSYGTLVLNANGSYTYTPGAAAQALGAGQNVTDVFTYTISDGQGGTSSTTLMVTVQGANDAPIIGGPLTGTVTEDGTTAATGTLAITDTDAGQATFVEQTGVVGTYGTFSITSSGAWTYTLNNSAANVQALAAGASPTESFTVSSADGTTRTVVVTVNGSNDLISVADTNAITEGTTATPTTVTGDVTPGMAGQDRDVDTGSSFAVTGVAAGTVTSATGNVGAVVNGTYGTVTIAANGSYTYTLDNTRVATNGLALNQTATDTFSYTITDNTGATSTTTLTVTVTGTNDGPTALADAGFATEAGGVTNGTAGSNAAGNVLTNDTDPDASDAKTVSGVSFGTTTNTAGTAINGAYGSLTLNSNGSYSYVVDNSNATVQGLRINSQTVADTFTYTMRDASGATSTATLTVTIRGTNDAPVATADIGAVNEDAILAVNAASGLLSNDTDADSAANGETKAVTQIAQGANAAVVSGTAGVITSAYGTLTVNANGSYSYVADGTASQALGVGATATDSFTYTVRDAAGATSQATLTLTINGANDAPVNIVPTALTLTEDNTYVFNTALGGVSDVDGGILTTTITIPDGSFTLGSTANVTVTGNGTGLLQIVGTAAQINAALNNGVYIPTQHFSGPTSITVSTSDGSLTDTDVISINVTPVADVPTLSTGNANGIEGQWINLSLSAALTDTDGSETLTARSLSGIPVGASITDGVNTFTATSGNTTLNLSGWNLAALQFQGAANDMNAVNKVYSLTLNATSTEGATSSSASASQSFTITVTDTAPTANNDTDSTGVNSTIVGNVITGAGGSTSTGVDSIRFDGGSLTAVSYQGNPASYNAVSGTWTVNAVNGTFTISANGDYTYVSSLSNKSAASHTQNDWQNSGIQYSGFDGISHLNGGQLNTTAVANRAGLGVNFSTNSSNQGIGVESGNGDDRIQSGEFLVLNLGMNSKAANLGISNLGGGESGSYTLYDSQGNQVGTTTTIPGGSSSINITSNTAFQYIVVTAASGTEYRISTVAAERDLSTITPDVITYTLTDSDGDSSTATLTVTTNSQAAPVADTAQVYESGLASGTEAGNAARPVVATGNLLDNDAGISGNTVITNVANQTAVNGVITVNDAHGVLKVWSVADATHRVGAYEYTLTSATTQGSTDARTFTYQLTTSTGVTTAVSSSTLTVNVADDAPIGGNVTHTLQAASSLPTYNLVLVVDRSGSMGDVVSGTQTRMDVAKAALIAMLDKYDDLGNINVQIVDFSDTVNKSSWFIDSKASAIEYINSLTPDGNTYYKDAIETVMADFSKPAGANKNLVYFISDGAPNPSSTQSINTAKQAEWETFLTDNEIDISFAIGVGNGVPLNPMLPISWPQNGASEPYAIVVTNDTQLTNTLLATVDQGVVVGNVSVLSGGGTSGFLLGADGGRLQSVTVDGVTHSYNGTATATISTSKGGELTVNFLTGEYNYQLTVNTSVLGQQEIIPVTAVDAEGDTKTITMTIHLDYVANLDANSDVVLTNVTDGSPIVLTTAQLMHNDSTNGGASISTTSGAVGGTVTGTNTITYDPTSALVTTNAGFGTSATVGYESEAGNGSTGSAVDLSNRELFGVVTGADAGNVANASYQSYKFRGTMSASSGNTDSDFIRVYLKAGETVILDVDNGVDGGGAATDVDTQLFFYNAGGTQLASNSTSSSVNNGGGGSTSVNDPYLTYTVNSTGFYFVRVQSQASATSSDPGGDYDLWISINPNATIPVPTGFDYALTEGGVSDSSHVDVYGVAGSTITGTAADEILYGSSATDTLVGNAGDDVLIGNAGSDLLQGGAGRDRLEGGANNDTLEGGDGADILIGGSGNDILTGGLGSDVFVWSLADKGSLGSPAADTITDFGNTTAGEKLDLRDLLQGEQAAGVDANLDDYLHFTTDGTSTTVHISSSGGYSTGYAAGQTDQTILLQNVNLFSGGLTSDQQIIQDLITRSKLVTD